MFHLEPTPLPLNKINIELDYNCSFNFFILYLLQVNEIKGENNQYELTKRVMIRYLNNSLSSEYIIR